MSETTFNLVQEFWSIANANYDTNFGWSVFRECCDDQEVVDIYGDCKSRAQLFEAMATSAAVWQDKFEDAEQYRKEAGLL